MQEIENMITSKDNSYIKDIFNWNYILFKKYNDYLNNIENQQIIKITNELINLHFNNCNLLISLLEGDTNE